jgi:DNA-binding MarR family transcriptional regulator
LVHDNVIDVTTTTLDERTQRDGGAAGLLLAQLGRMAARRFKAALAPTGLTTAHIGVLLHLRDHGPTTQGALAAALDVDPGNLVAALNDLEGKELALRRRDPSDRRRHIVEISQSGAALLSEASRELAEAEEGLLGELDEAERSELQSLLSRVAERTLTLEEPAKTRSRRLRR